MTRWTAEVKVYADASKVPDGPIEAAKYGLDQIGGHVADAWIGVERRNDDGTVDNWMVNTGTGESTYIGQTRPSEHDNERST